MRALPASPTLAAAATLRRADPRASRPRLCPSRPLPSLRQPLIALDLLGAPRARRPMIGITRSSANRGPRCTDEPVVDGLWPAHDPTEGVHSVLLRAGVPAVVVEACVPHAYRVKAPTKAAGDHAQDIVDELARCVPREHIGEVLAATPQLLAFEPGRLASALEMVLSTPISYFVDKFPGSFEQASTADEEDMMATLSESDLITPWDAILVASREGVLLDVLCDIYPSCAVKLPGA